MKWDISKEDMLKVREIVKRLKAMGWGATILDMEMDLAATHVNGCPLDLDAMLEGRDSDLLHDMAGISRHLNRRYNGKGFLLGGCFWPRFAKKAA